MANFIPTGTSKPRATPKTIVVSPITSPPILTHQRDLIKRAETVGDNTCGWVNGDLNTPLVCEYPYYQPCLWSPELHAVGCCADAATTDCAWVTSCVPYSQVNNGCDSACQNNYLNTVCGSAYPLCATATFGGPSGYTYLSCTDTYGPTETMAITYYGGNGTMEGLPRYFSSYWYSSATATSTSTSTSLPNNSVDMSDSWFRDHKTAIIGAIAAVAGLALLIVVGCCVVCTRRARRPGVRGRYTPAPQQTLQQDGYAMPQYQGPGGTMPPTYQGGYQGYQGYQGYPHEQVYATPNK